MCLVLITTLSLLASVLTAEAAPRDTAATHSMPAKPATSPLSDACKTAKCAIPRKTKPKPVIYCIKAPCPQPGKPKPDDTAHPSKPPGGQIYCIKAPCPQRRG